MSFTRRFFLRTGAAAGAATLLGITNRRAAGKDDDDDDRENDREDDREDDSKEAGPGPSPDPGSGPDLFGYTPFTQELFIPAVLTDLIESGTPLSPTPTDIFERANFNGDTFAGGARTPIGDCDLVAHGIAPEFGLLSGACADWNLDHSGTVAKEFLLSIEETYHKFFGDAGPLTPIFSYRDGNNMPGSGTTPGPTVVVDYLGPAVLRNCNLLTAGREKSDTRPNSTDHDHETSIHLHGTHAPAHSDGYPDFYTLAGEARDYFYPNAAPRETDPTTNRAPTCRVDADIGNFDTTWIPTTLWYHDHAMDVTGFNVAMGLAGFYLVRSRREEELEDLERIPRFEGTDINGKPLDFGLALQDQLFDPLMFDPLVGDVATIAYDFLDHNGRLGDVFTVNGRVQPFHNVERRKYRIRFLNASSARIYEIRLSTRQKMCIIGTDSWLLPEAIEVESFQLNQGQRHDVIIDFRDVPDGVTEVFVENIMHQTDGRKAKEVDPGKQRDLLLKFEVSGPSVAEPACRDGDEIVGFKVNPDGSPGTGLWSAIRDDEVINTRFLEFDRSNGAWKVGVNDNSHFFNPRRADVVPDLGHGAERWFFENGSGGWWHPLHTHLEGFQIKKVDGELPRRERRFNSDLVQLEGGFVAELLIKFRTFTGPFAFHCHNIEHEDMRMMGAHDPTPVEGDPLADLDAIDATPPMDGVTEIDSAVSGVVLTCEQLELQKRLFFDEAGDLDRLEGRGVGIGECEFELDGG